MRLDLRHGVRNGVDELELARMRVEPHWRRAHIDPAQVPDWGDYRLLVSDSSGERLLFRQGFDSNVDPGARAASTLLSVRLPMPRSAVRAVVEKRRAGRFFQPVWETEIDPGSDAIDRSLPSIDARSGTMVVNGPAASKVDVAILGEGYREVELAKFQSDAERSVSALFSADPFRRRTHDFNIHAVFVPSAESGATDAYLGVRRATAFGCAYGNGENERTLAVHDQHTLAEAASAVPYDFMLVLVNARRYGGSAYFGGPAVVAADSAAAKYLVLHELAHVLGGLAEEYYIPSADGPTFRGNIEPWHPNVTISPTDTKWGAVKSSAEPPFESVPQTWNKAEYERSFAEYVRRYSQLRARGADESAIERLMAAERERQRALLGRNIERRRVGYFEGAAGYAKGVFRSEVDCIMFSLQSDYFCHACATAINRTIDLHTMPPAPKGGT